MIGLSGACLWNLLLGWTWGAEESSGASVAISGVLGNCQRDRCHFSSQPFIMPAQETSLSTSLLVASGHKEGWCSLKFHWPLETHGSPIPTPPGSCGLPSTQCMGFSVYSCSSNAIRQPYHLACPLHQPDFCFDL